MARREAIYFHIHTPRDPKTDPVVKRAVKELWNFWPKKGPVGGHWPSSYQNSYMIAFQPCEEAEPYLPQVMKQIAPHLIAHSLNKASKSSPQGEQHYRVSLITPSNGA